MWSVWRCFIFAVLLVVALLMQTVAHNFIEYVNVGACENCTMRLVCGDVTSIIAIYEADFQPTDNASLYYDDFQSKYPPLHPRMAINKRCSGLNYCSFILLHDCPGAGRWGAGSFTVKYGCVPDTRVNRYCNQTISVPLPGVEGASEGFIRNPGYPRYYISHKECRWKIEAPVHQKIKITIVDLSLIGSTASSSTLNDCIDLLYITDGGRGALSRPNTLFGSCEDNPPHSKRSNSTTRDLSRPLEILSVTETVYVSLINSLDSSTHGQVMPRRGLLLHYQAVGCVTVPDAPQYGYLVYRNDTYVQYGCCVGFIFAATSAVPQMHRFTSRTCVGNRWLGELPIPDCLRTAEKKFVWPKRHTVTKMTESSSFTDLILPSLIMALLFVINGVVLFVIYRYRQKNEKECADNFEELGNLRCVEGAEK